MYQSDLAAKILGLAASVMLMLCLAPELSSASTPLPIQEVIGGVDGNRIMTTISDLEAFGTRAFYLNQSEDAATYVFDRFSQLGLEVEYQDFMAGTHESRNVVATQRGSLDSEVQFLVGAHYDSENMMATSLLEGESLAAPGADDDASGVAAMIEIATVLSGLELNYSVKFVAFGAEEAGYDQSGGIKGSRHFVESEVSKEATYAGTAILDMIGYRGSAENHGILIVNEHNSLASATLSAASLYDLNISLSIMIDPSAAYSDHYSFWTAGYPSMLVSEALSETGSPYEFNPNYHTQDDTIDKLSAEQMTVISKALLGGVLTLNGLASPESDSGIVVILVLVFLCALIAVAVAFYILKVKK